MVKIISSNGGKLVCESEDNGRFVLRLKSCGEAIQVCSADLIEIGRFETQNAERYDSIEQVSINDLDLAETILSELNTRSQTALPDIVELASAADEFPRGVSDRTDSQDVKSTINMG